MQTSVDGIIGASHAMLDRPDSTILLSHLDFPVLVVHGADDQIIPVQEAEVMSSHIPNSQFVVIQKAGHLVNIEQPDQFNQALRKFLLSLA